MRGQRREKSRLCHTGHSWSFDRNTERHMVELFASFLNKESIYMNGNYYFLNWKQWVILSLVPCNNYYRRQLYDLVVHKDKHAIGKSTLKSHYTFFWRTWLWILLLFRYIDDGLWIPIQEMNRRYVSFHFQILYCLFFLRRECMYGIRTTEKNVKITHCTRLEKNVFT